MFVWIDPYRVKYGNSRFVAVAETVDEARKIAQSCAAFSHGEFQIDDNDRAGPDRRSIFDKEPTRVIDLPCGEWDYWSE